MKDVLRPGPKMVIFNTGYDIEPQDRNQKRSFSE
jgi:hypothetical protein